MHVCFAKYLDNPKLQKDELQDSSDPNTSIYEKSYLSCIFFWLTSFSTAKLKSLSLKIWPTTFQPFPLLRISPWEGHYHWRCLSLHHLNRSLLNDPKSLWFWVMFHMWSPLPHVAAAAVMRVVPHLFLPSCNQKSKLVCCNIQWYRGGEGELIRPLSHSHLSLNLSSGAV